MANAQLHEVQQHLRRLRDAQALTEAPDAQLLEWFARRHEEAPFAVLVRRHGPMVYGVSRRVLPHVHDAEDVFQATFLLLARKAASIRKTKSLGSWLHGVARRLALKARLQQARRLSREQRAADMRQTKPSGETSLSEVQAALDVALGELPEKYRAVLVLCYLEGKTQEEAARRLGCPLATVRTRVARGRKLLRERLAKHGLTLSSAGLATLLITSAAPAAAPAALVKAAVQAALPFAAGQSAATLCSQQAAGLVEGGLKAMFLTKVKTATGILLAVALVAGGAVLAQRVPAASEAVKPPAAASANPQAPEAKPQPAKPKPPVVDDKDTVAFSGRVLGPAGRPVSGAKLYVSGGGGYLQHASPSPVYGTTGPDGRFQFTVPKAQFHNYYVVTAAAPNCGPGWVNIPRGRKRDDLTLRLVEDDVPITGQIVDLEGKAVAGATLTVHQINAGRGEDLDPWLEAVKGKKGEYFSLLHRHLAHYTIALSPQVTTDATGRFRLTGIGRNRVVWAQLDGPNIASQRIQILTRPGKTIEVALFEARPENGDLRGVESFYGAGFRHVVAPGRPVIGVVRDKDTKKPLAGVFIRSSKLANNPISYMHGQEMVQTTTDAEGRYRLTGMPKGKDNRIRVVPTDDQPYLVTSAVVPNTPGLDPVTVDFELKQGVWIEGKVTDKVTGKPCKGAVEYLAMSGNPSFRDYPGFEGMMYYRTIKEDGSYKLVGLPGPGLVGVLYHLKPYLRCDARDDEFGAKQDSLQTYAHIFTSNYNALARINPAKGVASLKRDVTLDPGWSLKGTVLGPDGNSLAGARSFDLNRFNDWEHEWLKTADFVGRFNPHRPRELLFQYPEKGLVGVAHPPKENGGAVTARLKRGAAVTGRLVDTDGKPRAGVALWVNFKPKGWGGWFDYSPESITTDREGRFRIAALLPDYEFRLSEDLGVLQFGAGLRSGETKDLGDVRTEADKE